MLKNAVMAFFLFCRTRFCVAVTFFKMPGKLGNDIGNKWFRV